jgi:hypothetical protein
VILQAIVLTPDTRPTWTFEIGHWILDIKKRARRISFRRASLLLLKMFLLGLIAACFY